MVPDTSSKSVAPAAEVVVPTSPAEVCPTSGTGLWRDVVSGPRSCVAPLSVDHSCNQARLPADVNHASSFVALIALRLAAGMNAPSHSMPIQDFEASMLSAGAGVVSGKLAGVVSQKQAGASFLHFDDYRDHSEMDSVHDSDTKSGSEGALLLSAGVLSPHASKKLASMGLACKKPAGFLQESKKSAVDTRELSSHTGFTDFLVYKFLSKIIM